MIKTDHTLYYPVLLLLSTDRKTAESLSKICDKSGDTLLRIVEGESIDSNELINKAKQYFKGKLKSLLMIQLSKRCIQSL
jgi:hypothetical protein